MDVGTGKDAHSCFPLEACLTLEKKNQNSQNVDGTQNSLSLTTENSVKQYALHVTDQTVNFWVYPPSNPGTQETLAWFISVVTDTEDTA